MFKFPNINFEQWEKYTKTTMLIFMSTMFATVLYLLLKNDTSKMDDCNKQLEVWQKLYYEERIVSAKERRLNDSFKNVLIVNQMVIEQLPDFYDSVLKSKTNNRVDKILNR